jgi:hypothetical protein
MHREGCLAGPGHPANRANCHHPSAGRRIVQLRYELSELSGPASESGYIARQGPVCSCRRTPGKPLLTVSTSSAAVSVRAARLIPRSRSLIDRKLRLAASASSSWVRPASARSCLSSQAKLQRGPFATGPHLHSQVRCPPCGHRRRSTQNFLLAGVQIPESPEARADEPILCISCGQSCVVASGPDVNSRGQPQYQPVGSRRQGQGWRPLLAPA